MASMQIIHIVARDKQGVIGLKGDLPWQLPADLAYFKAKTMGHCMVMGRITFEVFPQPLKGRTHLVVSRQPAPDNLPANVHYFKTINEAIAFAEAQGETQCFIIGGGEIFKQTMDLATDLLVTEIDGSFDGDTYYPTFDSNAFGLVSSIPHSTDEKHKFAFQFNHYERV